MVEYPLIFRSESSAKAGDNSWTASSEGYEIDISVPEEFGGNSEMPSPETLYCMAVENCLVATFKTIAERKEFKFENIRSETRGELSRNSEGRPEIQKVEVELEIEGVQDTEKAEKIRETTLKNCFIHRSVKTEIHTDFEFK